MIKEVYFTEVKWKPTHDDLGGVSGKIVFKKPVSYQDYLSISRKEYLLLDENKDKEIERLNNIIKEVREKCDYLLNNDIVEINGRKYIKQEADNIVTSYIKEVLDKENI